MNQQAQIKWWRTFSKFQQSRERTWSPVINRALQKQIAPTIAALKESGLQAAIARVDFVPLEPIANVIKNIYSDAGRIWGSRVYQMVMQQVRNISTRKSLAYADYEEEDFELEEKRLMPIGYNAELIDAIVSHYRLFLLSKAVIPISQTTRDYILDLLIRAQEQGLSIQNVVDQLKDTDITRSRSRLIARTETGKASNFGAMFGARKTGYQQMKIWIAAKDFRTRRIAGGGLHEHDAFDHFNMNGVTVPLDEYFHVPMKSGGYENMMQPCDSNGSAADVIRCRCCVGFRPLRDNAGRPLKI